MEQYESSCNIDENRELTELRQRLSAVERSQQEATRGLRRARFAAVAALVAGLVGTAAAQPISDLIAFSPNTPARARDVNSNFQLLKRWIERKVGDVDVGCADGGCPSTLNGGVTVQGNATINGSVSSTTTASVGTELTVGDGARFSCTDCGSTSAFNGAADYSQLTIQGRVMSGSDNIHLSPPGGRNVVINDTYRAAGGMVSAAGAGLLVEGAVNIGGATTFTGNVGANAGESPRLCVRPTSCVWESTFICGGNGICGGNRMMFGSQDGTGCGADNRIYCCDLLLTPC